MRNLLVGLVVVGSLLMGSAAQAAPDYTVTCKPYNGGSGLSCPGLYVDVDSTGVVTFYGEGLDFSGNAHIGGNVSVGGGLDVGQWVTGDAAQFKSLSLWFGGAISFWDNAYASISAMSTGLKLIGNQILYMTWNGKGVCHVDKSLPNGTKTRWSWLGDDGVDYSTTSLAGVPTQCLSNQ